MVPYVIEKSVNKFRRCIWGERVTTSLPFLSGDTFKLACNVDVSNLQFEHLFEIPQDSSVSIFSPIAQVPQLISWLDQYSSIRSTKWRLFLHNGDNILHTRDAEKFLNTFVKIFSVNWLGTSEGVYPIPIGIENYRYYLNGDVRKFPRETSFLIKDWEARPIEFFVSFKISNNQALRSDIKKHLLFSNNVFMPENFLNPREYRKMLSMSKYVISPPGNGADCHRSWESMYFGAVPIVLQDFWPFGSDLPALSVQAWSDIQDCYKYFVPPPVENIAEYIKLKYFDF